MRKIGAFLRSSDATCLRFGLPLRFGLRCEHPRCQIASDVGRAMRTTKPGGIVWVFFVEVPGRAISGLCIGIVQKVFSEKASAIARMRQKCVKMGLVLLGKEERSKMRQKCVKITSKTFGGENLLDDTDCCRSGRSQGLR